MKNWKKVQFKCAKDDQVLTITLTLRVDYLLICCVSPHADKALGLGVNKAVLLLYDNSCFAVYPGRLSSPRNALDSPIRPQRSACNLLQDLARTFSVDPGRL